MSKMIKEIKNKLNKYDKKFEDIGKRIDDITNKKIDGGSGLDNLKEELEKLKSELNNLKDKYNDILNQVNDNKIKIELILDKVKENKDNFNLASNIASINFPVGRKSINKNDINNLNLEKLREDLDELKHNIENKIMEIEVKIDLLMNNSPNLDNNNNNNQNNTNNNNKKASIQISQTKNKNYDLGGLNQLMKKIEEVDKNNRDLDRSFKKFLSSFNLTDILEDIAKLKDVKADKFDIPEIDSFNKLFDEIDKKIKQLEDQISDINKRLDSMYTMILNKGGNQEVNDNNKINKQMLQGYVTKDEFESYKNDNEEEFNEINKELNKIKDSLSQLMKEVKKKADMTELTNLRNGLLEKLEELARACNLKFADKNECLKNFKHIEEQLKKILFLLKKRNEQGGEGDANSWLLAKKPINGYSCASCESYLGELSNDIKKHVPWNRLPLRESNDTLYRMGSGYSKMLQMITFDNNGNVNINPDVTNEDINTVITNDSNMMNINNMNMMGKTFYAKQRQMQSKTPIKIRMQTSSNDLINDNMGNNMNNVNNINNINNINNNIIEENKNNGNNNMNNINNKTNKNKNLLPKIKSDITVDVFEKEENNKNDPKITKIFRKSQSRGNLRQGGSKL